MATTSASGIRSLDVVRAFTAFLRSGRRVADTRADFGSRHPSVESPVLQTVFPAATNCVGRGLLPQPLPDMENPLRPSSKIFDAVRPAASAAKISAASPLVSDAQKNAASSQRALAAATSASSRPSRILVTAISRDDALAQARQIAAKFSRDLQPVDLRQVESKYIRETEKKLLALLDTAEETGAVLFFDEADALFGKRSEVKDAHDRYANLDVAYFRQQIENYPGAVIIATTQPARLDPELLKKHAFADNRPRAAD
jgi:hypothetical protein